MMEAHMEKNMGNEMETGIPYRSSGSKGPVFS